MHKKRKRNLHGKCDRGSCPGRKSTPRNNLSFAKTSAGFKISKIRQHRVTCYLDEFRRRTQLLRSTTARFVRVASLGDGLVDFALEPFITECISQPCPQRHSHASPRSYSTRSMEAGSTRDARITAGIQAKTDVTVNISAGRISIGGSVGFT